MRLRGNVGFQALLSVWGLMLRAFLGLRSCRGPRERSDLTLTTDLQLSARKPIVLDRFVDLYTLTLGAEEGRQRYRPCTGYVGLYRACDGRATQPGYKPRRLV